MQRGEVPQYQGAKGRFYGGESLLSYTMSLVVECQLSALMTVVQESVPETDPWSPDPTVYHSVAAVVN